MSLEYRPCTAPSDPKNHPQVIVALVAALGQVATGVRGLGFGRHGSLCGNGVFAALGKNLFDLGVRAGDDVY